MSSLWLLEAKQFQDDRRSETAKGVRFFLRPGTYTVGREADHCDIDIAEDRSISRVHATITVPCLGSWPAGEQASVTVAGDPTTRDAA